MEIWPKSGIERQLNEAESKIEALMEQNMDYTYFLNDQGLDHIIRSELLESLEIAIENGDEALVRALHTVIAHFSVPGTYMEGAYDGS